MYEIRKVCFKCNGNGMYNQEQGDTIVPHDPCPTCSGSGYLANYYIDLADIEDRLSDILDKCNDILEKLNE